MKTRFTIFLFSILCLPLFSQRTQENKSAGYHKSIFVEGFGVGLVSINYDMRLQPGRTDGWGFRTGIGYKLGDAVSINPNSYNFLESDKINIYILPVEVNYVMGIGDTNHSVIAGGGILPSYLDFTKKRDGVKDMFYFLGGYFSLGYRYQHPQSGIMFQVNWNPQLLRNNNSTLKWGGVSIGYSF